MEQSASWLTIIGGPAPYRDAIERGYQQDPTKGRSDVQVLAASLGARIFVVFCSREDNRGQINELAGASNNYVIAIVPDLDTSLYHWALRAGANGVLFEDNPVEYLCDVTVAALNHDVVVPRQVLRELLRPDDLEVDKSIALTSAGQAVLAELAQGATVQDIADSLHLNKRTVQRRINNLCLQLGAATPAQCVHLAHTQGLLKPHR